MAVAATLTFAVVPEDDGIYSLVHRDLYPNPLVVLIGPRSKSYLWPKKQFLVRFTAHK